MRKRLLLQRFCSTFVALAIFTQLKEASKETASRTNFFLPTVTFSFICLLSYLWFTGALIVVFKRANTLKTVQLTLFSWDPITYWLFKKCDWIQMYRLGAAWVFFLAYVNACYCFKRRWHSASLSLYTMQHYTLFPAGRAQVLFSSKFEIIGIRRIWQE